jgi:hypothetical protein
MFRYLYLVVVVVVHVRLFDLGLLIPEQPIETEYESFTAPLSCCNTLLPKCPCFLQKKKNPWELSHYMVAIPNIPPPPTLVLYLPDQSW